jgi:cobalt-zinc-cadmium efflux system membrane fusion protein
MKKYIIFLFLTVFVFCGGGEKETSTSSPENDLEGHGHQELRLSLEKQKEWNIEVVEVSETTLSSSITLPGVLVLNQNKTAHISSFAEGKVLSIAADLGNRVRKRQILLTINSPEFAHAQADFLQARAKLKLSRKEYERAKMLLKEKAIEQKEYLRRESEYEKAMTESGVLGSILHSFGLDHDQIDELIKKCESLNPDGDLCEVANPNLTILSPITGKIIFRDVIIGEHVDPEKTVFTVSDLTTLWALLDAYEKDLPFINKESRVRIQSSLYPEKKFKGKITFISDTIDEKLRTVKIRAEVSNKENLLKPNMFILGIIEDENKKEKYLIVPEKAVQNLNGKKIVFLQEDREIFVPLEIKIKEKIDAQAVISEGLQLGQKIVVNGAFYLKAELNKESFGEAHVH